MNKVASKDVVNRKMIEDYVKLYDNRNYPVIPERIVTEMIFTWARSKYGPREQRPLIQAQARRFLPLFLEQFGDLKVLESYLMGLFVQPESYYEEVKRKEVTETIANLFPPEICFQVSTFLVPLKSVYYPRGAIQYEAENAPAPTRLMVDHCPVQKLCSLVYHEKGRLREDDERYSTLASILSNLVQGGAVHDFIVDTVAPVLLHYCQHPAPSTFFLYITSIILGSFFEVEEVEEVTMVKVRQLAMKLTAMYAELMQSTPKKVSGRYRFAIEHFLRLAQ
jgi:hypothetical protein